MTSSADWSDWTPEQPFELRFRGPWLNHDDEGGPGRKVNFCGLKCIDFALLPPDSDQSVLYLLEVKHADWVVNKDSETQACDLFRCYFDSLAVLARYESKDCSTFREAARNYEIRLVLFTAPTPEPELNGPDMQMAQIETLKRKLYRKFRDLRINPEIMLETLQTLNREELKLFEARHAQP